MRIRSVLFVAGFFAVLAVYVLLFEKTPKDSTDIQHNEIAIWSLRGTEVSGLILDLGPKPIVLEKKNNQWTMLQPVSMEVDGDKIESLLSELEFLTAQRVIPDQSLDLSQYGLTGSQKKIRVKTVSGEQILILGSKSPMGKGLYVQVQGKPELYVVAEGLQRSFTKTPNDFAKPAQPVKNLPPPATAAKPAGTAALSQSAINN